MIDVKAIINNVNPGMTYDKFKLSSMNFVLMVLAKVVIKTIRT